uniref:Secreted protein n=1 Tax=Ciona intestinalis TaxID=7719 RepID=H2XYR2_CIOIN
MNVLFLPAFSFVLCLSSLIGVEGSCHECPPDSKCVVDNCVCYVGYSWNDPVTKQSCIKDPPSTTTPVPTLLYHLGLHIKKAVKQKTHIVLLG